MTADWDTVSEGYSAFFVGKGGFGEAFGPAYRKSADYLMCFQVAARHSNPVGSCHGGALATFADMQLLALPNHPGDLTKHTPTVSLNMDFLAPAQLGQWVMAKVEVVRVTRTLIFSQAVLRTADGAVARSSAVYRNNDRTGYPLG